MRKENPKKSYSKTILYHLHILDPESDDSISDDDFG